MGIYGQELTFSKLQGRHSEEDILKYPDIEIDFSLIKGMWITPEEYGSGRYVCYIPKDESYLGLASPFWNIWDKTELILLKDKKNHYLEKKKRDDGHEANLYWIRPDGKLEILDSGYTEILEPVKLK